MSKEEKKDEFWDRMVNLAKKGKRENRSILHHVCIRVENLERTERLLAESFGIGVEGFSRVETGLFQGEAAVSGAWINDEFFLELMEPKEQQSLGYDTGCATPIGHLSEIGFLTPDMDAELERLSKLGWKVTDSLSSSRSREIKLDMDPPTGFPIELMEVKTEE